MNEQHWHVIEQVQQHTTTTFPLDCLHRTIGMEWWNGMVEWNGGMEQWNRILEWPKLCYKNGV